MPRMLAAVSLVLSLTSLTPAAHAEQHYARPPGAGAPAEIMPKPDALVSRDMVRRALAARRARSLDAFEAYQSAGAFPRNSYTSRPLNVWRDEGGHFCAAATIIKMSGQDELVDRVAEQSNFIRLADVKQGPLMDWILTSGLTQDEIALIQEPFEPVPEPQSKLAQAETARLVSKYRTIEATIRKQERAGLEAATTRLLKNQALAWKLVHDELLDVD